MNTRTEINQEILAEVVSESLAKINPSSPNARRWTNAIAKATVELENNPFMTYELDSHALMVLSEILGQIYTANGSCQCKALAEGYPCWHRAAARLVTRYIEVFAYTFAKDNLSEGAGSVEQMDC